MEIIKQLLREILEIAEAVERDKVQQCIIRDTYVFLAKIESAYHHHTLLDDSIASEAKTLQDDIARNSRFGRYDVNNSEWKPE